mmetsp:Transcript_14357/g.32655  ORF Transcript_14357/g.32655 Transcript_14357/m.32655 type:complete len:215 (-) Transcript_14357:56-700(-)
MQAGPPSAASSQPPPREAPQIAAHHHEQPSSVDHASQSAQRPQIDSSCNDTPGSSPPDASTPQCPRYAHVRSEDREKRRSPAAPPDRSLLRSPDPLQEDHSSSALQAVDQCWTTSYTSSLYPSTESPSEAPCAQERTASSFPSCCRAPQAPEAAQNRPSHGPYPPPGSPICCQDPPPARCPLVCASQWSHASSPASRLAQKRTPSPRSWNCTHP